MAREKAMVREADSALDYVKPDAAARGPSDFQLAIKDLKRRPPALFGLTVLVVVTLMAIVPGLIAPLDPLDQDLMRYMQPPGYVDEAGPT